MTEQTPPPKVPEEIAPELVQQVAERVWQLWQEWLRIERERLRQN
jgi:hypothetical protein